MRETAKKVFGKGVRLRDFFFHDALASVVVFLVALPLCMGVAIASGLPPAAGLLTGIIGGIVVGVVQSPALQVSGPTATLAVGVLALVQARGPAVLGAIVLLAGLLQLLAGLVRGGRWFRIVPPSVVYGMLAGIGVLIAVGQFHLVVDDKPKGSGLENLLTIPQAIWKGLVPVADKSHHEAAIIGLITIVVLVVWNQLVPKKLRRVPAPLVAVLAATAVAAAFRMPIRYVAVPHELLAELDWMSPGGLRQLFEPSVLAAALTIAIIASAETLLSASAIDRLLVARSLPAVRTDYSRALITQGLGNIVCGLVGALPMAGVIVRSTANVEAGARTRLSVVLHGLWLLALVAGLPFLLERVPVSCLAAILVYTGYRLVDPAAVRALRSYGRSEVAIYAATVLAIVTTDLLKGVLVGLVLALAKVVYLLSRLRIEVEDDPVRNRTVMQLSGSATFLRLPDLEEALAAVHPGRELHVRFGDLDYLDHASLDLLRNAAEEHRARGGKMVIEWRELHHLPAARHAAVSAAVRPATSTGPHQVAS